ncbi:hypothetical protein JOF48_001856 [Arthrobacter stackebrandtii]|uniref:DUF4333 domain-containing protein n=1 Tax=Arthrobacter stackebrandtii TaxID=272161 RepID=A0ABS4YW80_9MICC|nr:hypothetical protein [Arthrobacter stackebrandtii]MBP2413057.1 hypothetical protein [Arthrobacter stackebrandtii]PYH01170.1 hypothetical protein CVV67_06155 [Arthrobacter stackebrandtii]
MSHPEHLPVPPPPGAEVGRSVPHLQPGVAPAQPAKSRKPLYFGLGGLAIGLAVGLTAGMAVVAIGGALGQSDDIPQAVEACSATGMEGVYSMDGGKSLDMQTAGKDSSGTTITTVACVLNELGAPQSLYSKIDSTRALDGTKSADWPGFTASWSYHPDSGLNIIVETAAK